MKKLVMFYEDREEFIKNFIAKYSNPKLAEKLSNFLLEQCSINKLYQNISTILGSENVILLESNNIFEFNQTINRESNILFWNITDGVDLYKGSYIPSYAKLLNLDFFGSSTYAQNIAQNKYMFTQKCKNLSILVPNSYLYNEHISNNDMKSFQKHNMYFVKLNDFDNNIGILEKSKCNNFYEAEIIAKNLYQEYSHQVLIQEYIDGDDVRVCFLDIENNKNPIHTRIDKLNDMLGIYYINKSQDGSKVDYIHEETGTYDVQMSQVKDEDIIHSIQESIKKIVLELKIKDYFAVDFRVCRTTLKPYVLEINTAPFISSERFKFYINDFYKLSLENALVQAFEKYL
jgi:D-alanine-D-alanine ligase-like ATP-grasp enzyme